MLTLADVIEALAGLRPEAGEAHFITEFSIDSRQVKPGTLFVALPGQRTDGHHFVTEAFAKGALAVLIQRPVAVDAPILDLTRPDSAANSGLPLTTPVCLKVGDSLAGLQQIARVWRQRFSVRVIGITGSVGKSSTKELTWAVLARRFNTLKSVGNLNNEIGLPLTLTQLTQAHERLILEMGMYDLGEIAALCDIAQPQVGLVTNIGPTHLERLKTIERIAQAKAELIEALPPGGTAILNYDDARVRAMADVSRAEVFTYGLSPEADLGASQVTSEGLEGIRFMLRYRTETIYVKVPLLGRHSVHTALGATAVGLVEGLSWEEIIAGLQSSAAQLRLVAVPGPRGSKILDDTYNASPSSTIAALNLLADLPARRRIAVLGEMLELGHYEVEGHKKVGCRAAGLVDELLTLGPRSRFISSEAIACGLDPDCIQQFDDTTAVTTYLAGHLAAGDVVLIKGSRSLMMEEIVAALSRRAAGADQDQAD
jgi:UDP-N-acetylmuramoyl-tripeptide--D-alanyl-D-alanine ligase